MKLSELIPILNDLAPLVTAEEWDNVGLLVGVPSRTIQAVMTCLTLTDTTLSEAIDKKVGLIVCHHPIPFKPLSRITSDTATGSLLIRAIESGIAIYSPHTAWDNASHGINQQLADILLLQSVKPLKRFPISEGVDDNAGVGRCGYIANVQTTIAEILSKLSDAIPRIQPRYTRDLGHVVKKVGIVCGSGGSMLSLVASRGCDAMLTGEATYHQCLEAKSRGIALLMIGHHASEFFAMGTFATLLAKQSEGMEVFQSVREQSKF